MHRLGSSHLRCGHTCSIQHGLSERYACLADECTPPSTHGMVPAGMGTWFRALRAKCQLSGSTMAAYAELDPYLWLQMVHSSLRSPTEFESTPVIGHLMQVGPLPSVF